MSQEPQVLSLSDLPYDTPARLTEIRGGRHLTRRLLALGLRQGSELMVVQRRGQGLVLACGEVRIAVGAGIADKLWVTPSEPAEEGTPLASEDESAGERDLAHGQTAEFGADCAVS